MYSPAGLVFSIPRVLDYCNGVQRLGQRSHLLGQVVGSNHILGCFNCCCVELLPLQDLLYGVAGLCGIEHNARAELTVRLPVHSPQRRTR